MTPDESTENLRITGSAAALRDAREDDSDDYCRWMMQGEWRNYDAPWEFENVVFDKPILQNQFQRLFLVDRNSPRKRLIITDSTDDPVGWVNRYGDRRFPSCWLIGICIGDDGYFNRGIGSDALRLWVDYLFANSDVHRIGLSTYDFNPRMIRVAEKLGFTHEGTDRELVHWQKRWVDRLNFGVLRDEWRRLHD
jgi:RimJ/RimL family protein N-acetyltransferase